ncbi:MAG: curli production assembly/transport protein CsgE [Gammaproteobacteria bacterium]|nr:curli production assembly/transport protein CsgE [Gammaproteobacteria bacterium]
MRPWAFLLLLILIHAPPARGIDDLKNGDDLGGVITDQTVTFIGHAFYRGFVSNWQEPPDIGAVNLTIRERPSARWGSLVWVDYRGESVFRTFLFPARKDADVVGARAATRVASIIEQLRLQRLMSRDPDVAANELWEDE